MDTLNDRDPNVEKEKEPHLDSPTGTTDEGDQDVEPKQLDENTTAPDEKEEVESDSAKSDSDNEKASAHKITATDASQVSDVAQVQTGNLTGSTIQAAGGDVITDTGKKTVNEILKNAKFEESTIQINIGPDEKTTDTDEIPRTELESETLQKIQVVFVPPQNYQEIFPNEERVFIIHGKKGMGKGTCAIHLGLTLWENNQQNLPIKIINAIISANRKTQKLIDFVRHPKFEANTIYIIEEAFEKGGDPTELELSSSCSDFLHTVLEKKKAYLLLTTTFKDDSLVNLDARKVSIVKNNIPSILRKHLDYYDRRKEQFHRSRYNISENLIDLVIREQKKLEIYLTKPIQIEDFCRKLKDQSSKATIEDLIKIIKPIEHVQIEQEDLHAWINALSLNAKLYAMLVILFEGVPRFILETLYMKAVQDLRNSGVSQLYEPRQVGFDDILEQIRAHENEFHVIEFDNNALKEEVLRQIQNYHHLLWSLIEMILEIIDTYKDREYWEFRRNLGVAIGRLGIYRRNDLEHVLNILAKHEHGGVVAVAGYALDEICRIGSGSYSFVTQVLENWLNSDDPDFMWAVGASFWRIYDSLSDKAEKQGDITKQAAKTLENIWVIFTKLAENFDRFSDKIIYEALNKALEQAGQREREEPVTFKQFLEGVLTIELDSAQIWQKQLQEWRNNNFRSIVHALLQIAWAHPQHIVKQIREWLQKDKNSNLYFIGREAGHQLFYQNSDPEIFLLKERYRPLLDLVKSLLSTNETIVNTMMRALLVWCQKSGWADEIHRVLLQTLNQANPEEIAVFRHSISTQWLDNNNISLEARRIGQSLIARSYLIEGVPMVMPGHGYGVISFDASLNARANNFACIARRLYERFNSQIDIRIARMGEKNILASGEAISTDKLQIDHDRPRLILPSFEEMDTSNAFFVQALTWGTILDMNDIQGGKWEDRLIIASVENQPKDFERITIIPIDRQISESETEMSAVESMIRKHFSQSLLSLNPDAWWTTLQKHLQTESTDIKAIYTKLNTWIENLDSIKHCQQPVDVARNIICTVLWLAVKNLSACVKIVKKWLASENELQRLIGAVCGKTLFRVYAHCEPIPSVDTHAVLLELAPLLADKRNWSGIDAVFYVARRWAEEPAWAERFLSGPSGDRSELIQLIEKVPPEQSKKVVAILADWAKPLKPKEGEETPPDSVIKLLEQLQLSVAINNNRRKPWHILPEGHSYGLIIVDTSARDSREREFFAEIASHVIKRLHEHNHKQLELMAYRMGDNYPIAFPKQAPTAEVILYQNIPRSRLLCPLFESYAIENVAFVLLLTNKPLLDQDDWLDTYWSQRIQVYSQRNDPILAKSFDIIPQPSKQEDIEDIIQVIVQRIEQKKGV